MTIVEFYGYNGICSIAGFMRLEECGDEKPLQFYDNQGFENGYNYPNNPYTENGDKKYYVFEQLKEAMMTDDMLIQYLVDYADESILIKREGYELRINESDETRISVSS